MLLDVEPEVERVLGSLSLKKEVVAVEVDRRASVCARVEGTRSAPLRAARRWWSFVSHPS